MARNILIGRRDFVRYPGVVFAGGGAAWTKPLGNLADINPQVVAEATGHEPADTRFQVDLLYPRHIGAFHFANLRTSTGGLMRLQASLSYLDMTVTVDAAAGDTLLTFADASGVADGMTAEDMSAFGAIDPGTAVSSHDSTTVTLSVEFAAPVAAGNVIRFRDSAFDTGLVSSWPQDLAPGDFANWGGQITLSGAYDPDFYAALGMPRTFVPPAPIVARYLDVSVLDTLSDEPLRIGCFCAFEVWEPPLNLITGWSSQIVDDSGVQRVPGGAMFVKRRNKRRRMNFGFDMMSEDEVLARQLDLMAVKGATDPTLVLPFPDDTGNLEKTAIYGLFSTENKLSSPFFGRYASTFQIEQII